MARKDNYEYFCVFDFFYVSYDLNLVRTLALYREIEQLVNLFTWYLFNKMQIHMKINGSNHIFRLASTMKETNVYPTKNIGMYYSPVVR